MHMFGCTLLTSAVYQHSAWQVFSDYWRNYTPEFVVEGNLASERGDTFAR